MPDGNDEPGVWKHGRQIFDPRDVVIALRQITPGAANQQKFADVVCEEQIELVVALSTSESMRRVRGMHMRKKMLPDRFLAGFGALGRNANAVFVGTFPGRLLGLKSVEKPIPEKWGHDKRKITVTVGAESCQLRQLFEQNRRPGTRQAGDKDGRLDRNAAQSATQPFGLQIAQRTPETDRQLRQLHQQVV